MTERERERNKGKREKAEVLMSFDLGNFHYALCPSGWLCFTQEGVLNKIQ